jgi:hypothetical protein
MKVVSCNYAYLYSGQFSWTNTINSPASQFHEQVTVSAASPMITTIPSPSAGVLGVRLQDSADLTGSYHATGSIIFRLYAPGVDPTVGPAAYAETVTGINGPGAYGTTVTPVVAAMLTVAESLSETAESLILSGVRQFMDHQPALAPRLRLDENPVAQGHPRGER